MFTVGHALFLVISFFMITIAIYACKKNKWQIDSIIKVCFVIAIICEIVKVFSLIDVIPVVEMSVENAAIVYKETGEYYPYLEVYHLPFELCSLQILFMFLYLIIKDEIWKKRVYSFIYGTALIGGILAILVSPAAVGLKTISDFVSSVRIWEFYIYHSMLIVLAIMMASENKYNIVFTDLKWTCILMLAFDIASLNINSIFSTPIYQNGKLIGLSNSVNFFSSYRSPLGFNITNKYEYLFYIIIRFLFMLILIIIVYLPFLRRKNR